MKLILKTIFGSHVYGTNIPTSDTDIKGMFIPSAEDILLQRAPKTIIQNTKISSAGKNLPTDTDVELFSVQQYLKLLMEGQSCALDLLFTPKKFYLEESNSIWYNIQSQKDQFIHKGITAFIGYAKQQAGKYGIKGTRVSALRNTLDFLSQFNNHLKLNDSSIELKLWSGLVYEPLTHEVKLLNEHIKFVDVKSPNGRIEPHLEVCNRKIPLHATVKYTKEIFQKIFDEYGARALLAEKNEGCDYKALMHAVRVCNQAKELLSTGHITFPRPEKDLLLQIRKGELPYKEVATLIENGLEELNSINATSTLRETPNKALADSIVLDCYNEEIRAYSDYK